MSELSLFPRVLFSSSSDEWATPPRVFAELDREFAFTLDPCATAENAKCARHFTIEEDGLAQPWAGERVFMNPPYSGVGLWMAKALAEVRRADRPAEVVACLVPSRTGSEWFHSIALPHGEVRFLRGRLRFGDGKGCAPFPSIVVVLRPPLP